MFGVNLSEQRQISPDNLSVQGPGDEELAVPGEGEAGHGLVVVIHGGQQLGPRQHVPDFEIVTSHTDQEASIFWKKENIFCKN